MKGNHINAEFGDFENSGDDEVDDDNNKDDLAAGGEVEDELDGEEDENPKRMTKQ